MKVSLVLVQAGGEPRDLDIKKSRVVIGRDPSAQIRIPKPEVSRAHCELVQESGKLMLRDLKSSNGTYLNGQRAEQEELKAGDVFAVGPAIFVVRIDGKPAEVDAASAIARAAAPSSMPHAKSAIHRPSSGKLTPTGPVSEDDILAALSDSNEDSSVVEFDFKDDDEKNA